MIRHHSLLVLVLVALLAVPAVAFDIAGAGTALRAGAVRVHDLAYRKMLFFDGLQRLSEKEVSALLPEDRSTLWWLWHRRRIEEQAARHPLIEHLRVANCGAFAWGCFLIKLSERTPRMLASLNDELWLVGADGGFMKPLRAAGQTGGEGAAAVELPLIKGMLSPEMSAEEARLRYQYVNKALAIVEAETGFKVSELRLQDSGEMVVNFRGGPAEVTFDVPDGDYGELREEARHLLAVLAELKGQSENVVAIDLAYKELAVVRTRETAAAPPETAPRPGRANARTAREVSAGGKGAR
jgi:hypothetical protein